MPRLASPFAASGDARLMAWRRLAEGRPPLYEFVRKTGNHSLYGRFFKLAEPNGDRLRREVSAPKGLTRRSGCGRPLVFIRSRTVGELEAGHVRPARPHRHVAEHQRSSVGGSQIHSRQRQSRCDAGNRYAACRRSKRNRARTGRRDFAKAGFVAAIIAPAFGSLAFRQVALAEYRASTNRQVPSLSLAIERRSRPA